jgi:perosamine synthetase
VIRLARPWIGDEEVAAASAALRSEMLVQGERVAAFERALAERCGRRHAIACGSGTAALEMALSAIGVTGRDVLCPDLSWPSPAHAIVRSGARPILVDVDPSSWNAGPEALALARTPETAAAIVVDQFGTPADHPAIAAALLDVPIVVDAACSLGATIGGRPSASAGAIACMSFHPRKLITTGEGGACLTDDDGLASSLRALRNHGQGGPGEFVAVAGNQRMTEMAAAIGLAQLARLEEIVERRRALAERYLASLPSSLGVQRPPAGGAGNGQTFGVTLPATCAREQRDALVARLRANGVEAGRLSYAIHRIGSMRDRFAGGPFPVADHIEDRGLALPLHPLLREDEIDRVLTVLDEGLRALEIAR